MAKTMIRSIEVHFDEPVELTQEDQQSLVSAVSVICDRYERSNSERVMWPSGIGQKMLSNPFMIEDGEPLEFDETVFEITCTERESYDDPTHRKET